MKTGLKFWRARQFIVGGLAFIAVLIGNIGSHAETIKLPEVTWESRWSEEKANGDVVEHPPYVAVNNIRLYKFSEMQSVTWRETLKIDLCEEDSMEKLYVFTVWQGGASQGEQLMLLSVTPQGIAVVGPYKQDFETLQIEHINSEGAPEFDLIGADENDPLARLWYADGELFRNEQ